MYSFRIIPEPLPPSTKSGGFSWPTFITAFLLGALILYISTESELERAEKAVTRAKDKVEDLTTKIQSKSDSISTLNVEVKSHRFQHRLDSIALVGARHQLDIEHAKSDQLVTDKDSLNAALKMCRDSLFEEEKKNRTLRQQQAVSERTHQRALVQEHILIDSLASVIAIQAAELFGYHELEQSTWLYALLDNPTPTDKPASFDYCRPAVVHRLQQGSRFGLVLGGGILSLIPLVIGLFCRDRLRRRRYECDFHTS